MASAILDTRPAPSPTLTNPDLILPYGDTSRDSCSSPVLRPQRPPSPSLLLDKVNSVPLIAQVAERISLNELKQRRSMSPQSPQSFSTRPSFSQLDNISENGDNSQNPRRLSYKETTPVTIKEVYTKPRSYGWETGVMVQGSDNSGSNLSEMFDDFDMGGTIEDDEQHTAIDSPSEPDGECTWVQKMSLNADEDADAEEWLADGAESEKGSPSYSTLSKRAEVILENAKKRLMLMEGNLRGARHSLLVTPSTSLTSLRLASELNISSYKDRHARSALGFTSGRSHDTRSTSNPVVRSPVHARGFSDTSFVGIRQPHTIVAQSQQAQDDIDWVKDRTGQDWNEEKTAWPLSRVIRSSRSQEAMRDSRLSSWGLRHDHDRSKHSESKPNLECLMEDDAAAQNQPLQEESPIVNNKRSSPTASDLRAQMNDLKGRISSLRQKTREDSEKRRSMQSLQSLNTYTAAEAWYSGTEGYKLGAADTDAGVGWSPSSPRSIIQDMWEQDGSQASTLERRSLHSRKDSADVIDVKDTEVDKRHLGQEPVKRPSDTAGSGPVLPDRQDGVQDSKENKGPSGEYDSGDNSKDKEGNHRLYLVSDQGSEATDDEEADAGTVYEEADAYLPAAERHEDRIDAFDYENFFLHSAMGTYSRLSRHSSFSSAESIETTKPEGPKLITTMGGPGEDEENEGSAEDDVPPLKKQPSSPKLSYYHRNYSITSISSATTTASFATAAEGQGLELQQRRAWDSPISPASVTAPNTPPSQTPLQSPQMRKIPSNPQLRSTPSFPHIATQLSPRRRGASTSSGSGGNNALGISNANSPASANASPSSSIAARSITNLIPKSQHRPRPVSTVVSNLLDEARTNDSSRMKLPQSDKALVYSLAESLRVVCTRLQGAHQQQPGTSEAGIAEDSGLPGEKWRERLARAKRVLEDDGEEDTEANKEDKLMPENRGVLV